MEMVPARPAGQRGRPKETILTNPSASPFVRRIEALINGSSKTQRQLATELGYDRPNIITMFKQGTTRLPAPKVALLAIATGADPIELMRLWLKEYEPDLLVAVEAHQRVLLTRREREWILGLRQLFPDGLPSWSTITPAYIRDAWPEHIHEYSPTSEADGSSVPHQHGRNSTGTGPSAQLDRT